MTEGRRGVWAGARAFGSGNVTNDGFSLISVRFPPLIQSKPLTGPRWVLDASTKSNRLALPFNCLAELAAGDAEELEHYRHLGRLLELMKARARNSLQAGRAG